MVSALCTRRGQGVAVDYSRAVALYSQACNSGYVEGCVNLGDMYEDGQGVTQNDPWAAVLFSKACDAGSAEGCDRLGT